MREALGSVGDRDAALVHFAESVSASEAAVLRRALAELPRRRTGKPEQ